MVTLGIIPARSGSTRVKNKNLRMCGGRPLLAWTVRAAVNSQLDMIVITTDSEEIRDVALWWADGDPRVVVVKRPEHLATAEALAFDAVKHVWDVVGKPEITLLLNPTNPCRWGGDIDAALEELKTGHWDRLTAVKEDPTACFIGDVKEGQWFQYEIGTWYTDPNSRPRSQDMEGYRETGAIFGWCTAPGAAGTAGLILPERCAIDIDTEFDLDIASTYLEREVFRRNPAFEAKFPETMPDEYCSRNWL